MKASSSFEKFNHILLFKGTACLCALLLAQNALSNPSGGVVTSGSADIENTASITTITQTTNKAIINWKDFSIGANELTEFKQPSAKSFTLNRVTGGNVSQIMGQLKANGNIYLINPNGILFGKGARVDVGGLVASTSPISDAEFLNDRIQKFGQSPSGASIMKEGVISIKNAGLAVLVSPTVINNGVIEADLGVITIASANHFTLDLYGDNLITFDAGTVLSHGELTNNGTLSANGGKVLLTAQSADSLLENIVNMNGIIEAKSVANIHGKVVLQGYDNSTIKVSGTIDVSGKNAGESGGSIQIYADNTYLNDGTLLDASGEMDGGFIETSAKYLFSTGGIVQVYANAVQGKAGLWYIDPLTLSVTDADALNYQTALRAGTNVSINADTDITFNNTGQTITWGSAANQPVGTSQAVFDVISDFDHNASGTILFNAGCSATVCQITTDLGQINFYYNPAAFPTADTFTSVTATGTGEFNAYMLVNSQTQLQDINSNLTGAYALNGNLSLAGTFTPINSFSGKFNGNGFTIDGLTISQATSNVGLFKAVTDGFIQNVTLTNVSVTNTSSTTGALVGNMTGGTLRGAFSVSGTVSGGASFTGGLIGSYSSATALPAASWFVPVSATNSANVSGQSNMGGLFGRVINSTLSGTFSNTGAIAGAGTSFNVGGIIGFSSMSNITLGTLINYGTVSKTSAGVAGGYGGVIGLTANSMISSTLINHGDVSAPLADAVGGIIGDFSGTISGTVTNFGQVVGNENIAGIIGFVASGSDITLSASLINHGDVSGNTFPGGVIGYINGFPPLFPTTVSGTLLNTGTVTGVSPIQGAGGVIGYIDAGTTFTSSASLTNQGSVSGRDQVGGVIGYLLSDDDVDFQPGSLTNTGAAVTGRNEVGGIIGVIDASPRPFLAFNPGTMVNDANVSGSGDYIGGILGRSTVTGLTFSNAITNNGNVTSTSTTSTTGLGGIIGTADSLTFLGTLLNTGDISGASLDYVGGLFGKFMNGSFTQAGNTGTVEGNAYTGGIVGELINSTLTLAYNNSNNTVIGTDFTGGIAGSIDALSSITNVLFGGTLNAASGSAGGIAGYNAGTITNALSVGTFNTAGASFVGALVGNNAGVINTSFFDTRAYADSVGTGNIEGTGYDSSSVLKGPDVYTNAGWNFASIWNVSSGNYPVLRFCTTDCTVPLRPDPTPPIPPIPPLPPSPPTSFSSLLLAQMSQVLTSYQLVNLPSSVPSQLPSITGSIVLVPLNSALQLALQNAGLSLALINQILLLDTLRNYSPHTMQRILSVLVAYYSYQIHMCRYDEHPQQAAQDSPCIIHPSRHFI